MKSPVPDLEFLKELTLFLEREWAVPKAPARGLPLEQRDFYEHQQSWLALAGCYVRQAGASLPEAGETEGPQCPPNGRGGAVSAETELRAGT